MTEEERKEAFLSDFKELENELLSLAKIKDEGHVSFSRALNTIYYSRLHPVLSVYENYDFLKTASDLRNILSHENDVCAPSEEYLKKFHNLKEKICHPLSCYDIATKKIFTCYLHDTLSYLLPRMAKNSLSHIPIVDEERHVLGIFSRSTLFDYLCLSKEKDYSLESKVSQFEEVTGINSHLNESFTFVSRYQKVDQVYSYLKREAHAKNLGLLLVTEHGNKNEKLLGVITLTDLVKDSIS